MSIGTKIGPAIKIKILQGNQTHKQWQNLQLNLAEINRDIPHRNVEKTYKDYEYILYIIYRHQLELNIYN